MLARLAVHTVKGIHVGPEEEATSPVAHDDRTMREVVEAASSLIGEPSAEGAVAGLQAAGLVHAWQLRRLGAEDWAALGRSVSIGLKVAILRVLDSNVASAVAAGDDGDGGVVLTENLRNFLMMPSPDGEPPKPMNSCAAIFMSLMLLPVQERQEMLLIAFELMALISGLLVPIPMGFLRAHGDWNFRNRKGWMEPVTVDDAMTAYGVVGCMCGFTAAMQSIMLGTWLLAVGRNASAQFYERLFRGLAVLFALILALMFVTLTILFWHSITLASSLVVIPACAMAVSQPLGFAVAEHFRCLAMETALEWYHLPAWVQYFIALFYPFMFNFKGEYELRKAAVRPAAERRAAALRAKAGLVC